MVWLRSYQAAGSHGYTDKDLRSHLANGMGVQYHLDTGWLLICHTLRKGKPSPLIRKVLSVAFMDIQQEHPTRIQRRESLWKCCLEAQQKGTFLGYCLFRIRSVFWATIKISWCSKGGTLVRKKGIWPSISFSSVLMRPGSKERE